MSSGQEISWTSVTRLAPLGVRIDPALNTAGAAIISAGDSSCTVRVVPADEERAIARHTATVVAS
jgi:acetate kinase